MTGRSKYSRVSLVYPSRGGAAVETHCTCMLDNHLIAASATAAESAPQLPNATVIAQFAQQRAALSAAPVAGPCDVHGTRTAAAPVATTDQRMQQQQEQEQRSTVIRGGIGASHSCSESLGIGGQHNSSSASNAASQQAINVLLPVFLRRLQEQQQLMQQHEQQAMLFKEQAAAAEAVQTAQAAAAVSGAQSRQQFNPQPSSHPSQFYLPPACLPQPKLQLAQQQQQQQQQLAGPQSAKRKHFDSSADNSKCSRSRSLEPTCPSRGKQPSKEGKQCIGSDESSDDVCWTNADRSKANNMFKNILMTDGLCSSGLHVTTQQFHNEPPLSPDVEDQQEFQPTYEAAAGAGPGFDASKAQALVNKQEPTVTVLLCLTQQQQQPQPSQHDETTEHTQQWRAEGGRMADQQQQQSSQSAGMQVMEQLQHQQQPWDAPGDQQQQGHLDANDPPGNVQQHGWYPDAWGRCQQQSQQQGQRRQQVQQLYVAGSGTNWFACVSDAEQQQQQQLLYQGQQQQSELVPNLSSAKRSMLQHKPRTQAQLQHIMDSLFPPHLPPPVENVPRKRRSELEQRPKTELQLQQMWVQLFPRRQQRLQELVDWEKDEDHKQMQRGREKLQRWLEQRQLQRLQQQQQQDAGEDEALPLLQPAKEQQLHKQQQQAGEHHLEQLHVEEHEGKPVLQQLGEQQLKLQPPPPHPPQQHQEQHQEQQWQHHHQQQLQHRREWSTRQQRRQQQQQSCSQLGSSEVNRDAGDVQQQQQQEQQLHIEEHPLQQHKDPLQHNCTEMDAAAVPAPCTGPEVWAAASAEAKLLRISEKATEAEALASPGLELVPEAALPLVEYHGKQAAEVDLETGAAAGLKVVPELAGELGSADGGGLDIAAGLEYQAGAEQQAPPEADTMPAAAHVVKAQHIHDAELLCEAVAHVAQAGRQHALPLMQQKQVQALSKNQQQVEEQQEQLQQAEEQVRFLLQAQLQQQEHQKMKQEGEHPQQQHELLKHQQSNQYVTQQEPDTADRQKQAGIAGQHVVDSRQRSDVQQGLMVTDEQQLDSDQVPAQQPVQLPAGADATGEKAAATTTAGTTDQQDVQPAEPPSRQQVEPEVLRIQPTGQQLAVAQMEAAPSKTDGPGAVTVTVRAALPADATHDNKTATAADTAPAASAAADITAAQEADAVRVAVGTISGSAAASGDTAWTAAVGATEVAPEAGPAAATDAAAGAGVDAHSPAAMALTPTAAAAAADPSQQAAAAWWSGDAQYMINWLPAGGTAAQCALPCMSACAGDVSHASAAQQGVPACWLWQWNRVQHANSAAAAAVAEVAASADAFCRQPGVPATAPALKAAVAATNVTGAAAAAAATVAMGAAAQDSCCPAVHPVPAAQVQAGEKCCVHCHTKQTSLWRKLNPDAPPGPENNLCNKCAMWRRNNGTLPDLTQPYVQQCRTAPKADRPPRPKQKRLEQWVQAADLQQLRQRRRPRWQVDSSEDEDGDARQSQKEKKRCHDYSDNDDFDQDFYRGDAEVRYLQAVQQRRRQQREQTQREQLGFMADECSEEQEEDTSDSEAENAQQEQQHHDAPAVRYEHIALPRKDAEPGDYKRVELNRRWSSRQFEAAAAAGAKQLGVPVVCPRRRHQQQRLQSASVPRTGSAALGSLHVTAAVAAQPGTAGAATASDQSTAAAEHVATLSTAALADAALAEAFPSTEDDLLDAFTADQTAAASAGLVVVEPRAAAGQPAGAVLAAAAAGAGATGSASVLECRTAAGANPSGIREESKAGAAGVSPSATPTDSFTARIRVAGELATAPNAETTADAASPAAVPVYGLAAEAAMAATSVSAATAVEGMAVETAAAACGHITTGAAAVDTAVVIGTPVEQAAAAAAACCAASRADMKARRATVARCLPESAASAEFGVLMLAHDKGVPQAAIWQEWEAAHNGAVVVLVHLRAGVDLHGTGGSAISGSEWIAAGRLLSTRIASQWGDISLTEAILAAASEMLQKCPQLQHIAVVSGQDIPTASLPLPLPVGASMFGCFQFGRKYDDAARDLATLLLRAKLRMAPRVARMWGNSLTFHHTWLIMSRQLMLALLSKQDEILSVGAVLNERFMQPDAAVAADEFLLCTAAVRYGFVRQIERRSIAAFARAEKHYMRQQQQALQEQQTLRHQNIESQYSRKQQIQQQVVRYSSSSSRRLSPSPANDMAPSGTATASKVVNPSAIQRSSQQSSPCCSTSNVAAALGNDMNICSDASQQLAGPVSEHKRGVVAAGDQHRSQQVQGTSEVAVQQVQGTSEVAVQQVQGTSEVAVQQVQGTSEVAVQQVQGTSEVAVQQHLINIPRADGVHQPLKQLLDDCMPAAQQLGCSTASVDDNIHHHHHHHHQQQQQQQQSLGGVGTSRSDAEQGASRAGSPESRGGSPVARLDVAGPCDAAADSAAGCATVGPAPPCAKAATAATASDAVVPPTTDGMDAATSPGAAIVATVKQTPSADAGRASDGSKVEAATCAEDAAEAPAASGGSTCLAAAFGIVTGGKCSAAAAAAGGGVSSAPPTGLSGLPPRRTVRKCPGLSVVAPTGDSSLRHRPPSGRLSVPPSSGLGSAGIRTRAVGPADVRNITAASGKHSATDVLGYGVLLDCCPTLALFHPTLTRHPHTWRNFTELLLCDVHTVGEHASNKLSLLQALGLARPNGALFFRKVDVVRQAAQETLLKLLRLLWQEKYLPANLTALGPAEPAAAPCGC